jgi:uncharacterized protein
MRKSFLLICMALLLIPQAVTAAGLPEFPFVFVSGQSETEVAPDIATLSFRIEAFNENPDIALKIVNERSAEVFELFSKNDIEKKDVIAYEISKDTVRQTKEYVRLGISGYEIKRRISVTIRKLNTFDQLMTHLLNLKNISNIQPQFDTTKRKDIETELTKQAAVKARQEAEILAKGFGSEVLSIYAISTSPSQFGYIEMQFGFGPGHREYAAAAYKSERVNVYMPNTIKLQQRVNAIFKIK